MLIRHIVIDCLDNERLTPFWCAATGYVYRRTLGPYVVLVPPERGTGLPLLLLQRVQEPKTAKNRVHLDVGGEDIEAAVERLVQLGATRGPFYEEDGELCVIA